MYNNNPGKAISQGKDEPDEKTDVNAAQTSSDRITNKKK